MVRCVWGQVRGVGGVSGAVAVWAMPPWGPDARVCPEVDRRVSVEGYLVVGLLNLPHKPRVGQGVMRPVMLMGTKVSRKPVCFSCVGTLEDKSGRGT